jgi:NADH-quinone oxidoreductase subunit L
MTAPLVILSTLAVASFVHGLPLMPSRTGGKEPVLQNYLTPVFETAESLVQSQKLITVNHEGSLLFSYALAWAIALAGAGAAVFLYRNVFSQPERRPLTGLPARFRELASHKFYVDEIYEFLVIRPVKWTSFLLFKVVDSLLIDTLAVRGTAWVTQRTGSMLRYLQTGDVQSYAAIMTAALLAGVAYVVLKVIG